MPSSRPCRTNYHQRGINKGVVTVITQVLVDKNDPAFQKPTKPIGSLHG